MPLYDALAEGGAAASVLRAEFIPTAPFCPQSDTLAVGSFRAWNGLADRHGYDLVRVRVAPMHHAGEGIDATIERLEERFEETGGLTLAGRSGHVNENEGVDGLDHRDRQRAPTSKGSL